MEVGLDGRSSLYPYDQGWGEGTIVKVHPLVSEFPKGAFHGMDASRLGAVVPYMVQLHKGKTIVPCPIDDPDFIRAKGAKYQTGAPTRFKVGDSVECKIGPGPDDWIPGTVRALWQPYPGWGRGWRELGMFGYERDSRQTPDCCPYHVTPDGKRFDGKVVGATNIMVPADNDGYIRTSAKFREKAAADAIEAANAAGHTRPGREQLDAVVGAYKESVAADPAHVAALDEFIALLEKTVQLAVVGLGNLPEKRVRRAIRALNPRKLPRKGDARRARTVLLKLLIQECKNDAKYERRFRDMLEDMRRRDGEQYDISDVSIGDRNFTIGRRDDY